MGRAAITQIFVTILKGGPCHVTPRGPWESPRVGQGAVAGEKPLRSLDWGLRRQEQGAGHRCVGN